MKNQKSPKSKSKKKRKKAKTSPANMDVVTHNAKKVTNQHWP